MVFLEKKIGMEEKTRAGAAKVSNRDICVGRKPQRKIGMERSPFRRGAGNGTRTRGLLITNELLYQLSYTSKYRGKGANATFPDYTL